MDIYIISLLRYQYTYLEIVKLAVAVTLTSFLFLMEILKREPES